MGDAAERAAADELQGVFVTARPGLGTGDEDVDVRLGPITHEIDERDLGAQVVRVAGLTVEEYRRRSTRGRGGRRLARRHRLFPCECLFRKRQECDGGREYSG